MMYKVQKRLSVFAILGNSVTRYTLALMLQFKMLIRCTEKRSSEVHINQEPSVFQTTANQSHIRS